MKLTALHFRDLLPFSASSQSVYGTQSGDCETSDALSSKYGSDAGPRLFG
ncbi:hypothetical protein ACVWWG_003841 [Bradyrhizobium sp. LB7.2]